MKVVDHEPHAWFLFEEGDSIFLDVNCDHGAAGYSVMIELSAEEALRYVLNGRAH